MSHQEVVDANSRVQKEYSGCGHGSIESWEGFSSTIERVQDSSILILRKGLHDGGHLKIDSPEIGEKAIDGVDAFHDALVRVVRRVVEVRPSSTSPSEVLTSDDGGMTALQLRMTSLALMSSHGTIPNLDRMREVWSLISRHPDEKLAGETLANLMAVFKGADQLQQNGGSTFPLTDGLVKLVVETSGEPLTRQAPSPIRRWLAQSLYTGYHNGLHAQYPLMLAHGNKPEVDVALHSLDLFATHSQAGGAHRQTLAAKYAPALRTLLDGGNPNTSRDDLAVTPAYGRRDVTLLEKGADVRLKLEAIARSGA